MSHITQIGKTCSKQVLLACLIAVFSFFPYGEYIISEISFGSYETQVAYGAGDGSVGNPFTDLFSTYRASRSTGFVAGTYNFNIDGNVFSSYVDADGWVAVASADNSQLNSSGFYPEVTALTLTSDTILDRDILAAATPDALRMVSTGGVAMDRTTTEQRYIDRLRNFTTLGSDSANDNVDWVLASGTGNINGGNSAALGGPLNEVIWHSTGIAAALHWFPNGAGSQEDGFNSQANTSETTLYMRDTSPNITPGGVEDDLVLWLRANEGGTAWTDESGVVTTLTSVGSPTLNTNSLNFNDQITFNGASRYNLTNAGFANGTGDKAVYVVGSHNPSSGAKYAATLGSGNSNQFVSFGHWANFADDPFVSTSGFEVTSNDASWPVNTSAIVGYSLDGGTDQLHTNGSNLGIAQDDVALGVANGTLGWIGGFNSGGAQWSGDIAEVVVYNQSTNSSTDRKQIESYLAIKYGMTLNASVGSYKDSSGNDVYDLTSYSNNIVGIARDDATGLDQRVSKSVNTDAVLTISTDDTTPDFTGANGTLRAQLADGEYVVLGSNSETTTTVSTTISGYLNKINRQWKAEVTNYTGEVHMKFDISAISGSDWDLVQSDMSDFTDAGANLTKVADVSASGEIAGVTLVDGKFYGLLEEGTLVAPGGVGSDLALWLKADAGLTANGNNEVTDWNEQSNARVESINGTPTLISNGLNFNPWVEFDPGTAAGSNASTDWIDWVNFTSAYTEGQAYIVMEHDDDPATGQFHGGFWGLGEETVLWNDGRIFEAFGYNVSGANRSIFDPAQPFDEPLVYSAAIDNSPNSIRTIRIDGLQVNAKNNTNVNFGSQAVSLGRTNLNSTISSNRGFGGRIAEFIVFSSDQDILNEAHIESYLALKYGITLDQSVPTDYISSDINSLMYKATEVNVILLSAEANRQLITVNNPNGPRYGITTNAFHLSENPNTVGTAGQEIIFERGVPKDLYLVGPTYDGPGGPNQEHNGTVNGVHLQATLEDNNQLSYTVVEANRDHPGPGNWATRSYNSVVAAQNLANSPLTLVSSDFDLLFDVEAYYEHDIFGIGRDDTQELDQRISKSVNDDAIITITTGDSTADFFSANTTARAAHAGDLDFQTVANNDGAAAWTTTGAPAGYQISERTWQIQERGTAGAINIAFDVDDPEFDIPTLLAGTQYHLVHDTDADLDLSDETPIALSNNSADIWSTNLDFADNAVFVLATSDIPVDIAGVSGGLTLWLDADDEATVFQNRGCTGLSVAGASAATTGDVGCWLDKSGQNNHVKVLTDESREPLYINGALNGKNVLDFQGDSLVTDTGSQITSNTGYTKFAVFRYDTNTPYNNIISASSNAGGGHAFFGGVGRSNLALFHGGTFNEVVGQPGTGTYTVGTGRYGAPDSLTNVTNVNGVESAVSVATRNFNGTHRTEIGSVFGGGFGLDGHLAEAIVFDRALTDTEVDEVECYLATKWDVSISNDSPNCTPTLATVEFSVATGVSTDETTNDNFVELLVNGTTTAPATVEVSIIGGTASTGNDYTFTNPTTVTIPAGAYDGTNTTAITVPLPVLPGDLVAEGNETIVFELVNPTGEAVLGDANQDLTDARTFSYTISDDDSADILVSVSNNLTSETGPGAAVVFFTLGSEPTHPVTVTLDILGAADQSEANFSFTGAPTYTSTVTIAPADWNTPQLALIFGLDDSIDDGNQNVTVVTSGSTSTDPNYNLSGTAIADAVIINQDDDISDIVVSTNDNETSENGDTATVTLTPSSAPTEEVLIPITITDPTEGSVTVGSVVLAAGSLAPVDVVITGVDDTDLDIDTPYQIIFGDPISVDAGYDALGAIDVANQNLINLDDDDSDNDGNRDSIENAGTNGGDGNGDGTPDSQQQDVSGTPNPVTGDYTTLEASGACTFITQNASVAEGSLVVQDPTFDYPVGLVDFQVRCTNPGDSSDVTIYYGQEYDTTNWTWRKFNENGEIYSDITSRVTFATSTVGTTTVTTASFTVTDGNPATDEDGVVNGFINDPSGPAVKLSSGGGGGGSAKRVCRDPEASNYKTFGKSDPRLCQYEEESEVESEQKETTAVSVTDSVCSPYLTETIALNRINNPEEVEKLQNFLNDKQGENLTVDGVYNQDDFEAVKRFQEKYAMEVLDIWGLDAPTGYVYLTTRNKINSFYCTADIQCPYFTEFNSTTQNNNSNEVLKTKILMSELGFYNGTLNESWGADMRRAMISFQETFKATMLTPWGLTKGTGYKYKTTNRFLNNLVGCKLPAETLENGVVVSY